MSESESSDVYIDKFDFKKIRKPKKLKKKIRSKSSVVKRLKSKKNSHRSKSKIKTDRLKPFKSFLLFIKQFEFH